MTADGVRIHPTAAVEAGVTIGAGSSVWDSCHLRSGAVLGEQVSVGEKTYIAGGVRIGDRVKLNSFVYLCAGVTLETGVMIAAGVVFTNDRYPRATTPDLSELRSSEVGDDTLPTLVREGATVGARAVVGCGLTIGAWALVGMGAVVTRTVKDHELVVGSPARPIALVCRCGPPFARLDGPSLPSGSFGCAHCGWAYEVTDGVVASSRAPGAPTDLA